MADFRCWLVCCVSIVAGNGHGSASPLQAESLQDGLYSAKMKSTPSLLSNSSRKSAAEEMKRIAKLHQRGVALLIKDGGKPDCALPSAAEGFPSTKTPVAECSLLAFLREERRLLETLVLREDAGKTVFLSDFYLKHRIMRKEERRFGDARDVYLTMLQGEFEGMFRAYCLLGCGEGATSGMPATADMSQWEGWVLENLAKVRQHAGTLASKVDAGGN